METKQKSRPGGGAVYARSNISNVSPIDTILHRLEKSKWGGQ